jgi:WD40 repeat protein
MSWSRESRVRVFDAASYAELGRWKTHDALVLGLDVRPDGTQIATAAQDQSVRVWSCPSGAQVAELIGHDQDVLCVRWSPDGARIATGGRDNRVRLWDARTFEQVAVLAGHTDYVYSLAWSPDGTQLASGSGDGTVRLWETRTSAERAASLRERRELVERWQREIVARLAAGDDAHQLAESLRARTDLESREREVALQLLLQRELSRSPSGTR